MKIEHLVQRAQRGNAEAVAALYQMFVQPIYRFILYRVPTDEDAEDLTAEVFLKMVKALPTFQWTGAPFEAWLYRIAAARIIDFRRRANRRPQISLEDHYTDGSSLPEESLQDQQEVETLRAALQQLSDEKQTVLILRFIEHKTHEEVAAILGRSSASVRVIQHRALTELTVLLGSQEKVRHYLRGQYDQT